MNENIKNFGNIDCIIKSLDIPDSESKGKLHKLFLNFNLFIFKLKNFIFGDHVWHTNKKARKFIKYFLLNAESSPDLKKDAEKVLEIYDKLQKTSRTKNKSYSEGIRRNLIERFIYPKVSPSLLYHINADEFGANSSLEGSHHKIPLQYVLNYLNEHGAEKPLRLKNHAIITSTLSQTSELLSSFDEKNIQKHIENSLASKKQLLLPGGWTGTPGHAMYYEIIPQKDDKITFRIYNYGAGSGEHPSKQKGVKTQVLPYVEWINISKDKFLDPHFTKIIYELNTYIKDKERDIATDYQSKDIYSSLKLFLSVNAQDVCPKNLTETEPLGHFQRTGVCAYASLLGFLRCNMSKDEYKRFSCDIRVHSLLDYLKDEIKNDKLSDSAHWRLVNKSFQKAARKINRLYRDHLISTSYFLETTNSLKTVSEWLKAHESSLKITKAVDLTPKFNKDFSNFPKDSMAFSAMDYSSVGKTKSMPEVQSTSDILDQVQKKENYTSMDDLFEHLDHLLPEFQKAYQNGAYDILNRAAIQLVTNIPFQNEFWTSKTDQNIIFKRIETLGHLADIFFNSCFKVDQADKVFLERFSTLKKLVLLQSFLAKIAFPIWGQVKYLGIEHFDLQFLHRILPVYNSKIREEIRFNLKLDFLKSYRITSLQNYNIELSQQNYICFLQKNEFYSESLPTLLKKINPTLFSEIANEIPNFNSLSKEARAARIYTSEKLPAWLKSIRDAYLKMSYIRYFPVAKLKNLDKAEFSFKIEDNDNIKKSIVYISNNIIEQIFIDNPKLNPKEKNDKSLNLVRKMINPSMQKFFKQVHERHHGPYDEKEIITLNRDFCGMTEESYKEILHLFIVFVDKSVSAIEYFTKYPEKLNDPDYQNILEYLLFFSEDDHPPELVSNYLNEKTSQYLDQNDLITTIFLLKLKRHARNYEKTKPLIDDPFIEINNLLLRPNLEPEVKSLLLREAAATLLHKKDINEKEIALLLYATVWLNEKPVPVNLEDPLYDWDARDACRVHATAINNYLIKNNKANNQVLQNLFQKITGKNDSIEWVFDKQEGQFPIFSTIDGNQSYFPLVGKFINKNKETFLPEQIISDPDFKKLFPNITKAVPLGALAFSFKDQHGFNTFVNWTPEKLWIEQQNNPLNEEWYAFIPSNSFLLKNDNELSSALQSRHLINHFTHWHSRKDSDKILMIDSKTGQKSYEAIYNSEKSQIESVRRLSDNALLNGASSLLNDFEDPSYIHLWHDNSGKLFEIELPRFGLTFKASIHDSTIFNCLEYPGWHLAKNQVIDQLGHFTAYLVLSNEKGQKKVIIPNQEFIKFSNKPEVFEAKFASDQKLQSHEIENVESLVFDVDPMGKLKTPTSLTAYTLIKILLATQNYKEAAYIFRSYGEKIFELTAQETALLTQISTLGPITGDKSGEAIAFYLFASLQLMKNSLDKKLYDSTKSLYLSYLQHYHNITFLKLTQEEEIYLLKELNSDHSNIFLNARLSELTNTVIKNKTVKKSSSEITSPLTSEEFTSIEFVPRSCDLKSLNLDKILITRPFITEYNFNQFATLAIKGTKDEKKWVNTASTLLMDASNKRSFIYGLVLQMMLRYPDKFSSFQNSNIKENANWWSEAVKQSLALFKNKSVDIPSKDIQYIDKVSNLDLQESSLKKYPFPSLEKSNLSSISELVKANHFFTDVGFRDHKEKIKALKGWLKDVRKNTEKKDNPILHQEIRRIKKDIEVLSNKPLEPVYGLNKRLDEFEPLLQKKEEVAEQINQLQSEILSLANHAPETLEETSLQQVKQWGGINQPITLEDVLMSFAKKDTDSLLRNNQYLNETDLSILYNKVVEFLLLSSKEQQRQCCLEILETLKKDSKDQELVQQFAETLLAERTYNPTENPAYLVFEYYASLLMRPNQVENLNVFLTKGDLNPIREMIMGSGKSKVLLPLLGFLRADGQKLSTIFVPQSLFENIASDAQSSLQKSFNQKLRSLHFDRNTPITKTSLEHILDLLNAIKRNKECLIMTSKSIQCLLLKYLEQYDSFVSTLKEGDSLSEELVLLQKILSTLKESSVPLIDEVDTVFNILHEVSFSKGNRKSPNLLHAEIIGELYSLLYNDPELKSIARLESDPSPKETAPVLNEDAYHKNLKTTLVNKFLEHLKRYSFEDPATNEQCKGLFKLSGQDFSLLKAYIVRDPANMAKAQILFNKLPKQAQEVISLFAEEVSHLLPHTLTQPSNEKYGLGTGPLAIPYRAAKVPSIGSDFANPHVTMNYTFQIYFKEGITKEIIIREIERLQKLALKEMQEVKGLTLKKTNAWKLFTKIKGSSDMPLFLYKEKDLESLVESLNKDFIWKKEIIKHVIIPQLQIYEEKISCNPINLFSLFFNLSGFTGTLWNTGSMHSKMMPLPEEGTDAKTLSLLWANSRTAVETIKEGSSASILNQIKEKNIRFDLISDAGGYFKDSNNQSVSDMISRTFNKPVVYYDSNGIQAIREKNSDKPLASSALKDNERLTFLDQCHTTGSDVAQHSKAVGLVTIGEHMLLRDLLQSAWRLRKLDKEQKVVFHPLKPC